MAAQLPGCHLIGRKENGPPGCGVGRVLLLRQEGPVCFSLPWLLVLSSRSTGFGNTTFVCLFLKLIKHRCQDLEPSWVLNFRPCVCRLHTLHWCSNMHSLFWGMYKHECIVSPWGEGARKKSVLATGSTREWLTCSHRQTALLGSLLYLCSW